jgi:phytanoyl-CoA hydroxylase
MQHSLCNPLVQQPLHSYFTPNMAKTVRCCVDLRYQPTDQNPMINHGVSFLARGHTCLGRIADLKDWLANRAEHED